MRLGKRRPGPRVFFLGVSVLLGLAAIFPAIALVPVREAAIDSRAPELLVPAARGLFAVGALGFAVAALVWDWIRARTLDLVAGIDRMPARNFWLLTALCALLPRILIAAAVSYQPTSDAAWLHEAAVSLARGDGFSVAGKLTAYRPPAYPFLLSLSYAVFGPKVSLAWFWGLASTAAIILAVHSIARRLHGQSVARLASLFVAVYPALVLMTGQSLSDLPFLAGLLWLVAFMLSGTPYSLPASIGLGLACGLLTLTRGVAIGLVVVLPVIWWLRQADWRRLALSMLLAVLGFSLCVAPWMWRNNLVFGSPTLGTNMGMNAYVGNHRGAQGGSVPRVWPALSAAEVANESLADRALMRNAVAFVRAHPAEAAANVPRKFLNFYLLETEATTSLFQGRNPSPAWMKFGLYGISQLAYVFFLALLCLRARDCFAGASRPRAAQWTGLILATYFTALTLVLHGGDRHRLPILPWILIAGAVVLARAARERSPASSQ